MSNMMAKMRDKLKSRQKSFTQDEAIFPFWKLNFGGSATLRFIPYEDEHSGGFWTEKKMLPMSFADPENPDGEVFFKAPCREMYDRSQKCPVANIVRGLYDEVKALTDEGQTRAAEDLKKIASKHWINLVAYYQGFVIKPGIQEDSEPGNPIRIFPLTKKLHNQIYATLMDEENPFDSLPTGEFSMEDIQALIDGQLPDGEDEESFMAKFYGNNFILKKTQQGEYANYDTSSWSRKDEPLTDEQIAAIAEHGYHDLSKKLPERPSDEAYEVLTEMMKVSVARAQGEDEGLWNPEWEEAFEFIKPYRPKSKGSDSEGGSSGSAVSSRIKRNMNKGADSDGDDDGEDKPKGGVSGSVRDRLKAKRGAGKKDEPAEAEEDSDAEDQTAEDQTDDNDSDDGEDEQPAKAKASSDLASRIKGRVKKKQDA